MANFEKGGKTIHGTTQVAAGGKFDFGLWGPWYKSNPASSEWDLELEVSLDGPPGVTLTKGRIRKDPSVREYSVSGLSGGSYTVVAKDRFGGVWTTFTLTPGSGAVSSGHRLTAAQLTTKSGAMGWPGWNGASPAVRILATQLETVSAKVLAKNVQLQGAGHGKTIDEHYSGLSLDIMLNAGNADDRAKAHNLVRFFVAHRAELKWINMFYESMGFSQKGPAAPSERHDDHIHIDWMDARLAEPPGVANRKKWTAITWPQVAMSDSYLKSGDGKDALQDAWDSSTGPLDPSDPDAVADLYR